MACCQVDLQQIDAGLAVDLAQVGAVLQGAGEPGRRRRPQPRHVELRRKIADAQQRLDALHHPRTKQSLQQINLRQPHLRGDLPGRGQPVHQPLQQGPVLR
jgi:hypothetical protein